MSVDETQRPELRLEVVYHDLSTIHPNPWNPNVQNTRTYEAEVESIKKYGFRVPMQVRSHPEKAGEWQIVDGEHRWKAAQDLGYAEGPTLHVDDLSEADVKKLTLAFNMHGDPDLVPLGKLLVELSSSFDGLDALRDALPYDARELEELLKIGQANWGDFDPAAQSDVEDLLNAGNRSASGHSVTLGFDKAQRERYDTFHEILARELGEAYTPEEAVLSSLSGACSKL